MCIPSIYQQELWDEFQNIRQTMQGRYTPIHLLTNKIKQMQILMPNITNWQYYQKLIEAMDSSLYERVGPFINESISWREIVEQCENFETRSRRKPQQDNTSGTRVLLYCSIAASGCIRSASGSIGMHQSIVRPSLHHATHFFC